jgi:uncharacterized protein YlxW (UPF0749 family)
MKLALSLLSLILAAAFSVAVAAEDSGGASQTAAQTVETLRAQLLDVQTKEAELQTRARQLDEDLKPENIERSLAGYGSTRPEELREYRRRQLTIERDGVRSQLKLLAASRERLESLIRTAETRAYLESAQATTPALNQVVASQNVGRSLWLFGVVGGLVAIAGIALLIAAVRRRTV